MFVAGGWLTSFNLRWKSHLPDLSVHVIEALAILAAPEVTDGDLASTCSDLGTSNQLGAPHWCRVATLHDGASSSLCQHHAPKGCTRLMLV